MVLKEEWRPREDRPDSNWRTGPDRHYGAYRPI